jgi:hypothetical protein
MKKFKTVHKEVTHSDYEVNYFTSFKVTPLYGAENAWTARIEQTEIHKDRSKQTIITECFDEDVLRAMDKCQTQVFSTGLAAPFNGTKDDPTDILWNQIVAELEKQFGFSLA